jgi:hypothetical protein
MVNSDTGDDILWSCAQCECNIGAARDEMDCRPGIENQEDVTERVPYWVMVLQKSPECRW